MARSKKRGKSSKSSQWAARHNRDRFVAAARQAGYRARAVYKLAQIDGKYRLLTPGAAVVDLGSAPGSWSQYAAAKIHGVDGVGGGDGRGGGDNNRDNNRGRVIAVDKRPMKAVEKVHFIRGDFTDAAVIALIIAALGGRPADLVLSDLSPDLSGIRAADQARAEELQSAVLAFCEQALKPGGALLTKVFAGEAAPAVRKRVAQCFAQVRSVKPEASRAASKELYLLARGFSGPAARKDAMQNADATGANADANTARE